MKMTKSFGSRLAPAAATSNGEELCRLPNKTKKNTQDDWHKRTRSVDPVLLLNLMGLFRGVGGARGSGVGLLPNLHRHGHKSKRDGHHGVRGVPKTCKMVQVMGVAGSKIELLASQ